jgi:hypothetical protein
MLFYRLIANRESWYAGQSAEYYLLPSFAAFLIIFAGLLAKIYKKYPMIALTLIVFIVTVNLHTLFNLIHSQNFMFKNQTVANVIRSVGTGAFDLQVTGDPCNRYGYRYLFTYFHHEPATSYLDNSFGWLYEQNLPKKVPEKTVIINGDTGEIEINDL